MVFPGIKIKLSYLFSLKKKQLAMPRVNCGHERNLSFDHRPSSPDINMDPNRTETPTNNSFTEFKSEFACDYLPNFTWDLNGSSNRWILAAILFIASPSTVLLNASVMVVLKKSGEFQKSSSILMFNLAVADLLVGALCMPLSAITDFLIFGQVSLEHGCTLDFINTSIIFNILCWASLLNLTLMAWERYVAIRKWMDYKTILTKRRLTTLAIVCWLLAIFLGAGFLDIFMDVKLLFILMLVQNVLFIAAALGIPVSIIYLYFMVYLTIRQRKKLPTNQGTAEAKLKLESKVAKTCALITFVLFITFVQKIVISALGITVFPSLHKSSVFRMTDTFLQLNSLLNPLIYCFRDRRFRNTTLEVLKLKKPRVIQQAAGVVRFARKEGPFSQKVVLENRPRLTRSASCSNTVRILDYAHSGNRATTLKKSISAPSLGEGNGFFSGSQMKQPSSILTVAVTVHAEGRRQFARKVDPCIVEERCCRNSSPLDMVNDLN